jgi:flavin reductase (DIM6/NTAB) family NADH-FMN oxidoreductase RutF
MSMEHPPQYVLDKETRLSIGKALGRIPQSLYIMTSAYEHRQRGVLVSWVQQAGFDPPMVVTVLRKGRDIVPLIHESHRFALCQVCEDDRLTLKKFAESPRAGQRRDDDPLAGIETFRKTTGAPIIKKALSFLECELIRHVDIDGDHDLYVGLVRDGGLLHDVPVHVHLRDDGFKY